MRTNSYVTVWHLDEASLIYTRRFYKARVFFEERLAKGGLKQKSYHSGSRSTVRIPKSEAARVTLGDYVRCGKCYDLAPERISDLKVTRITENYFGANPHLKLFCGRASERS